VTEERIGKGLEIGSHDIVVYCPFICLAGLLKRKGKEALGIVCVLQGFGLGTPPPPSK
jgi:hypothetical protein